MPVFVFARDDDASLDIESGRIAAHNVLGMPVVEPGSEVESQVARDLPIILKIGRRVWRVFRAERLQGVVSQRALDQTQHIVGKPIARILPVKGERAAGKTGGVPGKRRQMMKLVPNIDGVSSADQ